MLSVLEAEGEGITSVLAAFCSAPITGGAKARRAKTLRGEVVILSRKGVSLLTDSGKKAACRILVVPGDMSVPASDSWAAVTYGMAESDDITLSSVSDLRCILAVRREIKSLSGKTVERQEFPVIKPQGVSSENLMAAYAGLLAAGIIV